MSPDQIVLLSPRPGRIHSIIRPELDRSSSPDDIRRDKVYLDTVEEIWGQHPRVSGLRRP